MKNNLKNAWVVICADGILCPRWPNVYADIPFLELENRDCSKRPHSAVNYVPIDRVNEIHEQHEKFFEESRVP